MVGDGERVQPWLLPGVRRLRRWQQGHSSHHATKHVTLGQLPDGRWLAECSDVTVGSRAYSREEDAERRITELTWDGGWVEIPAEYDAGGKPIGDGWMRSGGGWIRADRSEDAPHDR